MNKIKTFIKNLWIKLTKNEPKRMAVVVFLIFFIIGIVPKIARYIITSIDSREVEYVAITETHQIQDGAPSIEL